VKRSHDLAARWHRHGHLWRRVAETALASAVLALVAASDALHGALAALFEAADRAIALHPVAGPAAFVLFERRPLQLVGFGALAIAASLLAYRAPHRSLGGSSDAAAGGVRDDLE